MVELVEYATVKRVYQTLLVKGSFKRHVWGSGSCPWGSCFIQGIALIQQSYNEVRTRRTRQSNQLLWSRDKLVMVGLGCFAVEDLLACMRVRVQYDYISNG